MNSAQPKAFMFADQLVNQADEMTEANIFEWGNASMDSANELRRLQAVNDDLLAALQEIVIRIKDHPAYAPLTESEEEVEGGDTAELSYLARVGDAAIAKAVQS